MASGAVCWPASRQQMHRARDETIKAVMLPPYERYVERVTDCQRFSLATRTKLLLNIDGIAIDVSKTGNTKSRVFVTFVDKPVWQT